MTLLAVKSAKWNRTELDKYVAYRKNYDQKPSQTGFLIGKDSVEGVAWLYNLIHVYNFTLNNFFFDVIFKSIDFQKRRCPMKY